MNNSKGNRDQQGLNRRDATRIAVKDSAEMLKRLGYALGGLAPLLVEGKNNEARAMTLKYAKNLQRDLQSASVVLLGLRNFLKHSDADDTPDFSAALSQAMAFTLWRQRRRPAVIRYPLRAGFWAAKLLVKVTVDPVRQALHWNYLRLRAKWAAEMNAEQENARLSETLEQRSVDAPTAKLQPSDSQVN